MTGIQAIRVTQEEEWNQCIARFPRHDVYFTPGYVKGFQICGDGEPLLLYYDGENLKAMNIVLKRSVPVLKKECGEVDALS